MPSPPRRANGRVRVRDKFGAEKWVQRRRLQQVLAGGYWHRLPEPKPRTRPPRRRTEVSAPEPSASTQETSPAEPEAEKE